MTPNPAKAPWYFLWLQEIVTDTTVHIGSFTINGAFVGGVLLPGLLVTLLTAVAVARSQPAAGGRRVVPRSRAARRTSLFLAIVAVIVRAHARRHVLSRAVLAVLLAVAGLARDSDEAVSHGTAHQLSVSRSVDRPVLGVDRRAAGPRRGALHAQRSRARVALLPVRRSSSVVAEKLGADKARTVPTGLQQIWVPSLGRADRCITCHQAIDVEGIRDGRRAVPHASRRAAEEPSDREVRLHVVPRRPGLGGRRGGRRTGRSSTGRSRCSAGRSARRTRSSTTRPR